MKKLLSLILFACIITACTGQEIKETFAAYAKVTSRTGNTIVINTFIGNNRPTGITWQLTDMRTAATTQVRDVVYSAGCGKFIVTSRTGTSITFTDPDNAYGSVLPEAGEVIAISRDTLINGIYIGAIPQFGDGAGGNIAGIPHSLAGCLLANQQKAHERILAAKDSFRVMNYKFDGTTISGGTNLAAKSLEITTNPIGKITASANSGNVRYEIDMVGGTPVANGLTKVAGSNTTKLGGTLTEATVIVTDVANTLAIPGLVGKNGVKTDSLVTVDGTGKLSKIDAASISPSEILTGSTLPTTAATKTGNKYLYVTATDTTELTYIGGNKWRADIVKGSDTPSVSVTSGTQTIDYTSADITVSNLRYSYDSKTSKFQLLPDQYISKASFPTLGTANTLVTSIRASEDSAEYIVKKAIGGTEKYFRQTPFYTSTTPLATEGANIDNTDVRNIIPTSASPTKIFCIILSMCKSIFI